MLSTSVARRGAAEITARRRMAPLAAADSRPSEAGPVLCKTPAKYRTLSRYDCSPAPRAAGARRGLLPVWSLLRETRSIRRAHVLAFRGRQPRFAPTKLDQSRLAREKRYLRRKRHGLYDRQQVTYYD